jgi:hypothetical protein
MPDPACRVGAALSRLVAQVDAAQQAITAEFSSDNDQSALSRLLRTVEHAAETLVQANGEFHAEVRETLAALQARREEARRSPTHGGSFQDAVAGFLSTPCNLVGWGHLRTSVRSTKPLQRVSPVTFSRDCVDS